MLMIRWGAILRHYDAHCRPRVEAEHAWFAASRDIEEAIQRAARATDDRGKRFAHQRRITGAALEAACQALLANTESIAGATTFDALHEFIVAVTQGIRGTGTLYAYDTALRIAYYRDLLPTK